MEELGVTRENQGVEPVVPESEGSRGSQQEPGGARGMPHARESLGLRGSRSRRIQEEPGGSWRILVKRLL
jgi:hypothetical protein